MLFYGCFLFSVATSEQGYLLNVVLLVLTISRNATNLRSSRKSTTHTTINRLGYTRTQKREDDAVLLNDKRRNTVLSMYVPSSGMRILSVHQDPKNIPVYRHGYSRFYFPGPANPNTFLAVVFSVSVHHIFKFQNLQIFVRQPNLCIKPKPPFRKCLGTRAASAFVLQRIATTRTRKIASLPTRTATSATTAGSSPEIGFEMPFRRNNPNRLADRLAWS